MSDVIFEQPVYVGIIGGLFALLLAYLGLQCPPAHRKKCFAGAAVCILISVLLILWGSSVETENEKVRKTLFQTARDVESNDVNRMLTHIHPDAADIRSRAANEMKQYEFTSVSIKSNLEIRIDKNKAPMEAIAEFNMVARGGLRNGGLVDRVPLFMTLTLKKDGEEWKIRGYKYERATWGCENDLSPV